MSGLPFDYGEYEAFYADQRTLRALVGLDKLAKKLRIAYALIGGLAAYLYTDRPPHDEPDIDLMIYDVEQARKYIRALAQEPGFKNNLFDDQGDAIFAHLRFERDIQIDILTSSNERKALKTTRIKGVEVEPIETLVVEKLIRATEADVRMALDLLACTAYNRASLLALGCGYQMTNTLFEAITFARAMSSGAASKADIEVMVNRLKDE